MSPSLKLIRNALIFIAVFCVSGCGNKDSQKAVNDFTKKVQSDIPPIKPPMPIKTENFSAKFQTTDSRDPFASLESIVNSKKYPNSILQQYTLDSLHLVGILQHQRKNWAMLRAPDEKIYKITVGTRIGNQQSLVTKIAGNSVVLQTDQNTSNQKKESTLVLQKN